MNDVLVSAIILESIFVIVAAGALIVASLVLEDLFFVSALALGGPFFVIPFVIAGGTSIVCSLTLEGFLFNVLSNASILLSPSAFEGFCFDVLSPLAKEDVFSVDLDGAMILPLMRAVFSAAIDCRNLLRESEAGVIEFNKDGVRQREDMMSIGQERSKVLHET